MLGLSKKEREARKAREEAELAEFRKSVEEHGRRRRDAEAHIKKFTDYIEYNNELVVNNIFDGEKYSFTNARNNAESLMYHRLTAEFGKVPLTVHTFDVPYPYDWAEMIFRHEVMDSHKRRLYYKAHPKTEECDLCHCEQNDISFDKAYE